MALKPANRSLFFSRDTKNDPRLGDLARNQNTNNPEIILLGWPDDRGIAKNKGRVGAKKGPDAIRAAFYKCTPGFEKNTKTLADWGNLKLKKDIASSHQAAAKHVANGIQQDARLICIGGGNDYAYADLLGVKNAIGANLKLGVINIDSHFDVRDFSKGPNSGTPYSQALEGNLMKGEHFVEFGIQPHHNSPVHYDYVTKKNARIVTLENIQMRGARKLFYEQLQFLKMTCDVIVVSLDIDSVKQADAPGCSAPYPNGLSANDVEEIARVAGNEPKVKLFSVYEVSPPLDRDGQTAALAASAIWNFMNSDENESK